MRPQQLIAGAAVMIWVVAGCDQDASRASERQMEPAAEADEVEPAHDPMQEMPSMRELDEGPPEHVTYVPGEIEWEPGPASFEEGSEMATLEGDLAEEGVFTARFRLPDGFVINPHWHPNVERVTVLRGTFHLGAGEEVDRDAAEALTQGSFTSMPKEMVHHAIAEGDTVIQLTSVGPWEINYVDPDDDPRERAVPVGGR